MIVRSGVNVPGIDKEILKVIKNNYNKRNTKHFDAEFVIADLLVTRIGC
jgi:hypothetical protein